jgi:hypothetical protein
MSLEQVIVRLHIEQGHDTGVEGKAIDPSEQEQA